MAPPTGGPRRLPQAHHVTGRQRWTPSLAGTSGGEGGVQRDALGNRELAEESWPRRSPAAGPTGLGFKRMHSPVGWVYRSTTPVAASDGVDSKPATGLTGTVGSHCPPATDSALCMAAVSGLLVAAGWPEPATSRPGANRTGPAAFCLSPVCCDCPGASRTPSIRRLWAQRCVVVDAILRTARSCRDCVVGRGCGPCHLECGEVRAAVRVSA
jgi:hypothetical protein